MSLNEFNFRLNNKIMNSDFVRTHGRVRKIVCLFVRDVPKNDFRWFVARGVRFQNYKQVILEKGTGVNFNTKFYTGTQPNESKVILEENVGIGMDCLFITGQHDIGTSINRCGLVHYKDIVVKKGTWIGANCVILGGVTIGEGCIIQTGSVVSKNCKPNCIYGGNPAKLIMDLSKISALS